MKRAVVRLPSEVVERLDQLAQQLQAASPDRAVSRAAVVRALIATGLEVVEAQVEAQAARRREAGDIAEAGETGSLDEERGRG